ncbi:MAG: hypothetical protein Q8O87_04035 [bacterium]|nr:hypothetical protein [bacterium]
MAYYYVFGAATLSVLIGCSGVRVLDRTDGDEVSIVVDTSRSLGSMISSGKYDWVHPDITAEHFPAGNASWRRLNIKLISFRRDMQPYEVLYELRRLNLRAATLPELLALGEARPDLQKSHSIVGLESIWKDDFGDRWFPQLDYDFNRRNLDLQPINFAMFDKNYRFAAVERQLN